MGLEVFGIAMHFLQPGVDRAIRQALETTPGIRLHDQPKSPSYHTISGEYCDASHVIGFQLLCSIADKNCTLSARFSLCSYATIDHIFVDIVSRILSLFPAEVWLLTSALRKRPHYAPDERLQLIAVLPEEISAMRAYWQHLFGTKQGVVRAEDSWTFVGVTPKEPEPGKP